MLPRICGGFTKHLAGGTQRFFSESTGTFFGFHMAPLTVSAYFPADYTSSTKPPTTIVRNANAL